MTSLSRALFPPRWTSSQVTPDLIPVSRHTRTHTHTHTHAHTHTHTHTHAHAKQATCHLLIVSLRAEKKTKFPYTSSQKPSKKTIVSLSYSLSKTVCVWITWLPWQPWCSSHQACQSESDLRFQLSADALWSLWGLALFCLCAFVWKSYTQNGAEKEPHNHPWGSII